MSSKRVNESTQDDDFVKAEVDQPAPSNSLVGGLGDDYENINNKSIVSIDSLNNSRRRRLSSINKKNQQKS